MDATLSGSSRTWTVLWLGHGYSAHWMLSLWHGALESTTLSGPYSRLARTSAALLFARPQSESSFHGKQRVPAPGPLTFCVKVVSAKTEGEAWMNGAMRKINQNSSHPWTDGA